MAENFSTMGQNQTVGHFLNLIGDFLSVHTLSNG
jgi:hypothetical protein